ncbi:hydrolase, alpha/beta fold family protein [Mycobacterium xenopi 3993]|nr:hydrolase, alpha/beta fold family protein [Mycobacterium xenopi 3993]
MVGLSVPPVPRSQVPPTQALRKLFGDKFFYMLYFQEPGSPTPSWAPTRPRRFAE